MDLLERVNDTINEIEDLPVKSTLGYLGANESLVIYPLAGSNVIQTYMTGDKEEDYNYEIAMKSKSQKDISETLWKITRTMQQIKEIESNTESFKFEDLTIANMPFINEADDAGWYIFLLDITIRITNYGEGE